MIILPRRVPGIVFLDPVEEEVEELGLVQSLLLLPKKGEKGKEVVDRLIIAILW